MAPIADMIAKLEDHDMEMTLNGILVEINDIRLSLLDRGHHDVLDHIPLAPLPHAPLDGGVHTPIIIEADHAPPDMADHAPSDVADLADIKTEEDEATVLDVIAQPVDYEGPIIENRVDDAVFEDEGQVLRRKPSIRILESKAKVKAKKDTVQALIEANRASASANLRNKLSGRQQTGRKAGGKN